MSGFQRMKRRDYVQDTRRLTLPGIDHQRLTCRYQERDLRRTEVSGTLVKPILAG